MNLVIYNSTKPIIKKMFSDYKVGDIKSKKKRINTHTHISEQSNKHEYMTFKEKKLDYFLCNKNNSIRPKNLLFRIIRGNFESTTSVSK